MQTTNINIREAPSGWENNPRYVYCGRPGRGQDGYFGNPVKRGQPCPVCGKIHHDNGSTLPCYREYLLNRLETDAEFFLSFKNLRGKILVCFCKPGPCHTDIMIEILAGEERMMRMTAKDRCKTAQTMADVLMLIQGTYFSAYFMSADGTQQWGPLDTDGLTAQPEKQTDDGGWVPDPDQEPRAFHPDTRVRHHSSGEDIHMFVIDDPIDAEWCECHPSEWCEHRR